MIIEVAASAFLFWRVSSSYATSREAYQIATGIENGFRHLENSCSLGAKRTSALNELYSVAEECKNANWDGHGAAPISSETYSFAYRLVENLPSDTLSFTVGAEPDGHVTLEWYRSPRRTLSVSVSPEGELHYAALLGRRTRNGTELFLGEVPEVILNLISEVMASADKTGAGKNVQNR
jgi:hypothetical protein